MGKVVVQLSMSIDGFCAGPNDGIGNALGDNGSALMYWINDGLNPKVLGDIFGREGAAVIGRRLFDNGNQDWDERIPFANPTFVVTHRQHAGVVIGQTPFTFVTAGLEEALQMAQEVAGRRRDVNILGADISRQYITAGLVDEIQVHLVPVILGGGMKMFGDLEESPIELSAGRVISTADATHIRYKVVAKR